MIILPRQARDKHRENSKKRRIDYTASCRSKANPSNPRFDEWSQNAAIADAAPAIRKPIIFSLISNANKRHWNV